MIALVAVAVTIVGCGGTSTPGGGGGGASQPLAQQLPSEANGTSLNATVESVDTAGESGLSIEGAYLETIESAGGSRDTVEIGFVTDPTGELAASVIAIRAPGVDTDRFQTEYLAAVEADADVEFTRSNVGGKQVYVGEEADQGTAYLYFRGDTVFQVFGDEESAATMLSALP